MLNSQWPSRERGYSRHHELPGQSSCGATTFPETSKIEIPDEKRNFPQEGKEGGVIRTSSTKVANRRSGTKRIPGRIKKNPIQPLPGAPISPSKRIAQKPLSIKPTSFKNELKSLMGQGRGPKLSFIWLESAHRIDLNKELLPTAITITARHKPEIIVNLF